MRVNKPQTRTKRMGYKTATILKQKEEDPSTPHHEKLLALTEEERAIFDAAVEERERTMLLEIETLQSVYETAAFQFKLS